MTLCCRSRTPASTIAACVSQELNQELPALDSPNAEEHAVPSSADPRRAGNDEFRF
jgi:hypothetical protein